MSGTIADCEACPIHAEDHGEPGSPCVVLLQGLGMCVNDWPSEFLRELAQEFRVIRIDSRDAGRSGRCGPDIDPAAVSLLQRCPGISGAELPYSLRDMRDDVLRVLDRLEVQRFALVGFSMGGMIAQLVAARAEARVTAFAQICSSAGEARAPVPDEAWQRFLRVSRPFASDEEAVTWLTRYLRWCAAPTPLSADDAREAATAMVGQGHVPGGHARQLLALAGSGDRRDAVRAIRAPALVIGAGRDRCIFPESSARARQLIPNSELVMFREMGHALEPGAMACLNGWLRSKLVAGSARPAALTGGRA